MEKTARSTIIGINRHDSPAILSHPTPQTAGRLAGPPPGNSCPAAEAAGVAGVEAGAVHLGGGIT